MARSKNTRRVKTYTREEVDEHCQGVLMAWTVSAIQTLRAHGFTQEQANDWLKETNATCTQSLATPDIQTGTHPDNKR